MPSARKRHKKSSDQHEGAGRFVLSSQKIAWTILGYGALALMVSALASSSLSDPLQKLAEGGMNETVRVAGPQDFTTWRQRERLALFRRIAADADAVRQLDVAQLALLFGEPSLRREEKEAVSWHFTSAECALDIYFPKMKNRDDLRGPVYAEYRVRGNAQETGLVETHDARLDHRICVRALFSHARFPVEEDAEVNARI